MTRVCCHLGDCFNLQTLSRFDERRRGVHLTSAEDADFSSSLDFGTASVNRMMVLAFYSWIYDGAALQPSQLASIYTRNRRVGATAIDGG